MIKLQTICEVELWEGVFGIDQFGTQPTCNTIIDEDVEKDSLEIDKDGTMRPCYAVQCPNCKSELEWPQTWWIRDRNNETIF